MTRQLDVDRVLEDWLAQGPSQLPERAIQETIGRLDSVRQRKPSWLPGSERMNRLVLSASAIAAAVIVAVVAIGPVNRDVDIGGPSGVAFTSERHEYTVVLPPDTRAMPSVPPGMEGAPIPPLAWRKEERPGTWALGEFFDANTDSGVDYFEALDQTPSRVITWYVYLASQEIPEGMSFDDWVALHDAATDSRASCFELLGAYRRQQVDGETARIGTHRCEDFDEGAAWTNVQALVAHRGRGYAIYVWPAEMGASMPPAAEIEATADDWLAGFSFTD